MVSIQRPKRQHTKHLFLYVVTNRKNRSADRACIIFCIYHRSSRLYARPPALSSWESVPDFFRTKNRWEQHVYFYSSECFPKTREFLSFKQMKVSAPSPAPGRRPGPSASAPPPSPPRTPPAGWGSTSAPRAPASASWTHQPRRWSTRPPSPTTTRYAAVAPPLRNQAYFFVARVISSNHTNLRRALNRHSAFCVSSRNIF